MIVRTFDFIPFEEWKKTKRFSETVGEYTCAIKSSSKFDRNTLKKYSAVICNSNNRSKSNNSNVFEEYLECDYCDDVKLREWYESVTQKLNEKWENFILDTYLIDN